MRHAGAGGGAAARGNEYGVRTVFRTHLLYLDKEGGKRGAGVNIPLPAAYNKCLQLNISVGLTINSFQKTAIEGGCRPLYILSRGCELRTIEILRRYTV